MKELKDINTLLEEMRGVNIPAAQNLSYQSVLQKIAIIRDRQAPKAMVLTVLAGISILLSLNFLSLQHKKTSTENNILNELGLIQKLSIYGSI